MCGLVGLINKYNAGFTLGQENAFFEMLYADAVRGYDSTGVVGVTRHGDMFIAKEAYEAAFVIPQIKGEEFFKENMSTARNEGKIWIGHNRKATMGKTNDENAHPFVIDKQFAFVHNGTLLNHSALAKTDVDSKALALVLYDAMGKEDWKEALEEVLGRVWGAYACVWYDQRVHKLYMLRNKERPLSIIETPNAFYWASEPAMAAWILTRNGYKDKECTLISVKENTLMEFDVNNTTLKMIETEVSPKKAFTPVVISGKNKHTTTPFGGGTKATVVPSNRPPEWSKQQLKNFKRAWEGKLIRFWSDDYIETEPSKTVAQGATDVILLGECEDVLVNHVIRAHVNLPKLGIKSDNELTERLWLGTCNWIDYDKDIKDLVLNIVSPKPVVGSRRYPFPKSSDKDKTVVRNPILDRVEKMKDQYQNIGIMVIQRTTPSGIIELINANNNEVIYESPIAVH